MIIWRSETNGHNIAKLANRLVIRCPTLSEPRERVQVVDNIDMVLEFADREGCPDEVVEQALDGFGRLPTRKTREDISARARAGGK